MEPPPPPPTTVLTKEKISATIKEWLRLDAEIVKGKRELREKEALKKKSSAALVTIMKSNTIDQFDVHGGSLVYKQKRTKQAISKKFLLAQLQAYYTDTPELAHEIANHLLASREEKVTEELQLR